MFGSKKQNNVFLANFLDPLQGLSFEEMMDGVNGKGLWYKEEIEARSEEERKYYLSKLDNEIKELYFMLVYKNGEAETYCCDKATFFYAYNKLKST